MSLLGDALSRRQFFQTSAAAAGVRTLLGAEPHIEFPSSPRDRLSLTSWPFRRIMETPDNSDRDRSKPGIDAKDFAAMAVERFEIHNINPLTAHFRSTEPAYLEELRNAVAKAGSPFSTRGCSSPCCWVERTWSASMSRVFFSS